MSRWRSRIAVLAWITFYLAWGLVVCAWLAMLDARRVFDVLFAATSLFGLLLVAWSRLRSAGVARYRGYSLAFPLLWHASVYAADRLQFPVVRTKLVDAGMVGLFLIGMAWLIWYLERRWRQRSWELRHLAYPHVDGPVSNPFQPDAWYYGRRNAKLNQSLFVLTNYCLLFLAGSLLFGQIDGCQELYELPAGGGKPVTIAQTVKIQKVIKKKFVINPYSSIIFKPPPIDEVKLQLVEKTAHKYAIGQGSGDGAGFGGGAKTGKVRFIRLEYSGGDWDQDFGIGADLNMLAEYGARTSHQVAEQTESRTIGQLDNFPLGKSPPLMYLTGQRQITLSKSEIKTLREYLVDKQGMLFIDNGGSQGFHNQAFAMMRQVMPEIEPVKVPLDDVIHRVPYQIPFLPYVAPHGGRDAWGWKLNGRWICYYHPGDIGDAWSDGHSGVPDPIAEACYQLGVNVIFYAHAEYSKWLEARAGK